MGNFAVLGLLNRVGIWLHRRVKNSNFRYEYLRDVEAVLKYS